MSGQSLFEPRAAGGRFMKKLLMIRKLKFVVGEIVEMVAHPDSDHLNICQVAVARQDCTNCCRSSHARVLKTIVALPGAMMPKESHFSQVNFVVKEFCMMCSPRIRPNAPQNVGCLNYQKTGLFEYHLISLNTDCLHSC